jgi:glycosyltransferase involved in cell wall biosynthesis
MISIIIPCYNCERYITRAIESILNQTYNNYEVLLVNNNSTDKTADIIEKYAKSSPHIFKVFNETKIGAPAARNRGLYESKGEWIQYLDADDELMPDKLDRQLKILIENDADILAGCFIEIKNGLNALKQTVVVPDTSDIWLSLVSSNLGRTSSSLWKRQILLKLKGWNESLSSSQEYDLLFRALKNEARICFDTIPSTFIYFTPNSISKSVDKKRNSQIFDNWLNLRLDIREYLKEKKILTSQMNEKIDVAIFNYLRFKGQLNPGYAVKKLRSLTFDLPFNLKLRKFLVLLKYRWLSFMGK